MGLALSAVFGCAREPAGDEAGETEDTAAGTEDGQTSSEGETGSGSTSESESSSDDAGTSSESEDTSSDDATSGESEGTSSETGTETDTGSAVGCDRPVFVNDFDDDTPGPYVDLADWNDPPWDSGVEEGRVEIIEGDDAFAGRSLRIHYPEGGVGPSQGGAQWRLEFDASYTELYLAYRIRFAPGFDFVKGGKIPGLVGGTAPTGCVEDQTGFSARGMWRTDGRAVQYMYWPEKVENCGDDYDYMLDDTPVTFAPGQWHLVEHRLRMNTPGVADGVLQAWMDGELVLDEQDFLYRTADYDYAVDAMYFSTFFGGSGADWAPTTDETVDFDDFVVCEGPITH
ncbi:hypothetical protein PPSIR1_39210 [Plesiocystis pacifica SIR-1]|uniref:Polysaccharide lyase 14 domain-containing protein n=2 Tax=Plesiocystis pacifica TaxID=191768 RepID=A6GKE1_9BACT|nr:hypothetical protein PPSIR1_39210 [Plesiocystis pacifica SIR-1]